MAYKVKPVASRKYGYIRNRISKAQGKAKWIGMAYLLAIAALAVLLCFPQLTVTSSEGTVALGGIAIVKAIISAGQSGTAFFAGVGVFAAAALILLIGLIRSLVKLNWLMKKKASKLYGFNRNMYAMDDMGKYFSASFASVVLLLLAYVAIATNVWDAGVSFESGAIALLAVGLGVHFICGILAGNVSLFSSLEGGIKEEKREVGNFAPVLRNLLQLAACAALAYFLVWKNAFGGLGALTNEVRESFTTTFSEDFANKAYFDGIVKILKTGVTPFLCGLSVLAFIGMVYHALGTREFDLDGAETAGRKRLLAWSVVLLWATAGAIVCVKLWLKTETQLSAESLVVVGIALAMIVFELCLINAPAVKDDDWEEEIDGVSYLTGDYDEPGVYLMPEQSVSLGVEYDEPRKGGKKK
ncbi:MAG: hypothetical protein IJX91_05770 [Clostridia bacterium]|nr:hypothetical protein [Clostridia bacterium]